MLGFVLWLWMLASGDATPAVPKKNVDFARDVRPILDRCQPCHFPGGKMYAKLPFDRAETVDRLGTKLFTRIKKDDEQAIIRAFIARK
jgi:hypothetical protein